MIFCCSKKTTSRRASSIWRIMKSMETCLTEYTKAVPMDRRRRINIHSTHCFGSGMTEKGYGQEYADDQFDEIVEAIRKAELV